MSVSLDVDASNLWVFKDAIEKGTAGLLVARTLFDAVVKRDAEIAALKARAEKAEAERDAALAACAEMRAALTEIIARGQEQRGTGRMIETAEAALSRPDLGAGMVLVEREDIDEWRDLITDLVFDLDAHSRAKKAVADLDALLKQGGGK